MKDVPATDKVFLRVSAGIDENGEMAVRLDRDFQALPGIDPDAIAAAGVMANHLTGAVDQVMLYHSADKLINSPEEFDDDTIETR